MTRLFLFCDESGTMPVNDRDDPFCTATVAVLGAPPAITIRSGHKADLAEVFTEFKCVPQIVFVRPKKGYGALLGRKTSKLNTMARAIRLATGSNDYLPNKGHNARNTVWIRCMAVCVVRAVVRVARTEPICGVSVILDSKSMAEPSKRLFVDRVRSIADDIIGPRSDQSSDGIQEYIRFGRADVSVSWSDEICPPEFEGGLFLAHCLSGLAKTALKGATEKQLAQDLSVELNELFYDATPDVVMPLPRHAVEGWKRRTGLPEPIE